MITIGTGATGDNTMLDPHHHGVCQKLRTPGEVRAESVR